MFLIYSCQSQERKGFTRGKEFPLVPRKEKHLPRCLFLFIFFRFFSVYAVGCMFFLPQQSLSFQFLIFCFFLLFLGDYKGALPFIVRGYKGGEVLSWLIEAFRSNKRLLHWQKERGWQGRTLSPLHRGRRSFFLGGFLLLGVYPLLPGLFPLGVFFFCLLFFVFSVYAVGCLLFLPRLVFIFYLFWGVIRGLAPL